MIRKIPYYIALSLGFICFFAACRKYVDPPPADQDDRLTNKYCNDSKAVNFNWGFPGIPDNTVCIYPIDSFLGTWLLTDTTLLPNGNIAAIEEKTLVFTSTEDSVKAYLAVTGWCNSNIALNLVANKYNLAVVDTVPGGEWGQYLCGNLTDTITGQFNKKTGQSNTMRLSVNISKPSGIEQHVGTAVKQ